MYQLEKLLENFFFSFPKILWSLVGFFFLPIEPLPPQVKTTKFLGIFMHPTWDAAVCYLAYRMFILRNVLRRCWGPKSFSQMGSWDPFPFLWNVCVKSLPVATELPSLHLPQWVSLHSSVCCESSVWWLPFPKTVLAFNIAKLKLDFSKHESIASWDRLDLNKEISQQKGKSPCTGAVTQSGLTGSNTAANTRVCSSVACFGTVPILVSLCYVPYFWQYWCWEHGQS